MGITPVCMEDYTAQDTLPVDKCIADVGKSEAYVGIFAWRYGFIPPSYDKSITELEYRKAVEVGIPTLIFLLDESANWPAEFCDTRQDAKRIDALREEFKLQKMVGWFTNPHHLASEVQAAVSKILIQKVIGDRYAEVSVAATPEQNASVQQTILLLQEAMKQQSIRSQQVTRDPIPIQLPKLKGVFVDREVERDTLYHSLMTGDKRLVVIVAPGGYGKTELTTKVLKEIAPSTSIIREDIQGILYLKCVRGDITLGQVFSEAGRIPGKRDEFRDVYASKEMTLSRKLEYFFSELSKVGNIWVVMDNFEDLLDPADDSICDEEIREFLETAAGVEHTIRMIVTSRAVPRFKGSRKIEKIDLSKGLPEDQAIRYLREEGRDYGLDGEDEEVLRAFVQKVHCIPKALESVLGYLEDHYPSVTLRDVVSVETFFVDFDRHDYEEGLKKLVFEQFRNQSPDAQLLLSVLSTFPKPTPQAALRYLLPAIGPAEFAGLLARLEKNRLVSQNSGYYDLHPIVRAFVYERMPEAGLTDGDGAEKGALSRQGLHSRAAEFFHELRKPKTEWKTIDDLEPQLQEFHHLVKAGQHDAAARIMDVIDFDYLRLWGYAKLVMEMREQLRGKLGDEHLKRINAVYLGHVYVRTGQVRKALSCFEEALESARTENDKVSIGAVLGSLGIAYSILGEKKKAIEYYEQALMVAREFGDGRNEGVNLGNLGYAYSDLGEMKKAIEYHEQALAISREIGDRQNEGELLCEFGITHSSLGDTKKAIDYYEHALMIARGIERPSLISYILRNLAFSYHSVGHLEKAEPCYTEALDLAIVETAPSSAVLLGIISLERNNHKKAQQYLNRGITLCREALTKSPELYEQLYTLALALLAQGEVDESVRTYRRALKVCSAKGVVKVALMDLTLLERAAPSTQGLAEVRAFLNEAMEKEQTSR